MYKVIELFAGMGGIGLGFKQAGFEVVWANEYDESASKTYRFNFNDSILVEQDIREVNIESIPDFDVLTGGFPCQPFSIAGKQRGFKDKRGNLFFEIIKIVDKKRPKVIFLENVPNLVEHDNGKTFLVIFNSLVQFGYTIYYKIMSAYEYGNIPQRRKRIFIIAVRDDNLLAHYKHLDPIKLTTSIRDIINIEESKNSIYYYSKESILYNQLESTIREKGIIYTLHDNGLRKSQGDLCPTLLANMGTFPDRVPIIKDNFGIRKLTLRECLDLQGYPSDYYFPKTISMEDAYKQIGNSVCVPVIKRIAKEIKRILENMEN